MKKVILAIAVIAMIGAFASCSKKCSCKTYSNIPGAPVMTSETTTKALGVKKCSDVSANISNAAGKVGMECE